MFNHAVKAAVFPNPSHSTTLFWAEAVNIGLVVSSIVKIALVVEAFPQSSVAVKITSTLPEAPHSSDNPLFNTS